MPTRFHLIRHAIVEPVARTVFYGCMDVAVCPEQLVAEAGRFRALARHLPQPARWVVTPLSRTQHTAQAIFRAGYPETRWTEEPDLREQELGDWQGIAHEALPPRLRLPAHPFWPLAGAEQPPGGEDMPTVIRRVGAVLDRLVATQPDTDWVVVSHGGAIRAALAHALGADADTMFHVAIRNLSLTTLERHPAGWLVTGVNAFPG